jgi:hypothetical protein
MVTKNASRSTSGARKLKLKRETLKDLRLRGKVKGGGATTLLCARLKLGKAPSEEAATSISTCERVTFEQRV